MKANKREDFILIGVIFNMILSLGLILYIGIFQKLEAKTIYLSSDRPENAEQVLKAQICEKAFTSFKDGNLNPDLIHPEIINFLNESDLEEHKAQGIEKVFTKMTSRDSCRVIFKREKGFSGLNVVITADGPIGFRVTSLSDIKLTISDVRSYL